MEIRYPTHPKDFATYTTEKIRREFLIQNLFVPGETRLVYSHFDRMIVGGVGPNQPMTLEVSKEMRAEFFLARREMGVINVGPQGFITVDGEKYTLNTGEGIYIGMGAKEIVFASHDSRNPAHFYFTSGPAHKNYPTEKIETGNLETTRLRRTQEQSINTFIPKG